MIQDDYLELLRDVHAILVVDRDALYDCATNVDGVYDTDDDRKAVEEADALIARVRDAIESLEPSG